MARTSTKTTIATSKSKTTSKTAKPKAVKPATASKTKSKTGSVGTKAKTVKHKPSTDCQWTSPITGLITTVHYDDTVKTIQCKLNITDGQSTNQVQCSFRLKDVLELLKTNYNINIITFQRGVYSFDMDRVVFEKFLSDNNIKF